MEYLIMVGLSLVAVMGWVKLGNLRKDNVEREELYEKTVDGMVGRNRALSRTNQTLQDRIGQIEATKEEASEPKDNSVMDAERAATRVGIMTKAQTKAAGREAAKQLRQSQGRSASRALEAPYGSYPAQQPADPYNRLGDVMNGMLLNEALHNLNDSSPACQPDDSSSSHSSDCGSSDSSSSDSSSCDSSSSYDSGGSSDSGSCGGSD